MEVWNFGSKFVEQAMWLELRFCENTLLDQSVREIALGILNKELQLARKVSCFLKKAIRYFYQAGYPDKYGNIRFLKALYSREVEIQKIRIKALKHNFQSITYKAYAHFNAILNIGGIIDEVELIKNFKSFYFKGDEPLIFSPMNYEFIRFVRERCSFLREEKVKIHLEKMDHFFVVWYFIQMKLHGLEWLIKHFQLYQPQPQTESEKKLTSRYARSWLPHLNLDDVSHMALSIIEKRKNPTITSDITLQWQRMMSGVDLKEPREDARLQELA